MRRNLTIIAASTLLATTACNETGADAATAAARAIGEETASSADQAETPAPGTPLAVGAKAPMFTTAGALAGEAFTLNLEDELKNGPVVLYFFPAAFTSGCTLESKEFADRNAEFEAMGAKVFGLSGDDVETLSRFSTEACRDEFAVARADADVMAGYGVAIGSGDQPMAGRVSYVIAQDGTVAMVHDDPSYRDHVRLTFEAVQKMTSES